MIRPHFLPPSPKGGSNPPFRVESVVATAEIQLAGGESTGREPTPFDHDGIQRQGGWLVLRVGPSRRYVGVTRKGMMIVQGSRSLAEARRTLHLAAKQAVHTGTAGIRDFQVRNLVVTMDFGCPFDVNRIVEEGVFQSVEYEPELFPGLFVHFPGTKRIALLFSSGKAVITGARSLADVRDAITQMHRALEMFEP